jgi:hypothetical protein
MWVEQPLEHYNVDKNKLIDPSELACLHEDLNDGNAMDDIVDKLNEPSSLDACIKLLQDSKRDKTPEEQKQYDTVIAIFEAKKVNFIWPRENVVQPLSNNENNETQNPKEVIYETYKAWETGILAKKADIFQYEAWDGSINTIDFQEILRDVIPKINEFTNDVNEWLKTWKFDMKKMEMYGGIWYMLWELKGKFWNTIAERKVAIQKLYAEAPKMIAELNASPLSDSEKQMIKKMFPVFKSVLDALADPNSQLSLYIDHIAEPLAQQINWTLDYTNLESDQSKKAILNIFHRNPIEFNHLTDDFNSSDQTKKNNAEKVITTYYKIDTGKDLPAWVKVEFVSDMVIQSEVKDATGKIIAPKIEKPWFKFKNADGTFVKWVDKWDTVVYFGEEKTWNSQNFEQLLGANGPQWVKDLYKAKDGTVQLDMKTVADLAQQVNFEWWTKVKPTSSLNVYSNMSEAIKWFFDNPLLKELRKAFLTLSGMVSGDGKVAVQLNYLNAVDAMKSMWDTEKSKPEYNDYKEKDSKWLEEQVKKYPFKLKDDPTDDVVKLSQDAPWSEKHFFAGVLTPSEQIAYILNPDKRGDYQQWKNKQGINLEVFMENNGAVQIIEKPTSTTTWNNTENNKPKENTWPKEISLWQPYDALKINPSVPWLTGKVELSQDKKILTVDGQVVALKESQDQDKKTSSGIIRVKDKNTLWFVEHTLTVDNATGNISFTEWTVPVTVDVNSDMVKNIYDSKQIKFPIVQWSENIFNYFAFSKSIDQNIPNSIDAIYNSLGQDSLAMKDFQTKIAKLQSDFAIWDKTAKSMKDLIDKSGLDTIKLTDTSKQSTFTAALNNWKSMFTTEEQKTVAKTPVVEKV